MKGKEKDEDRAKQMLCVCVHVCELFGSCPSNTVTAEGGGCCRACSGLILTDTASDGAVPRRNGQ